MPRATRDVALLAAAIVGVAALSWYASRSVGLSDEEIIERFTHVFVARKDTVLVNRWMGTLTWQNPLDAWVTQEILWEVKPEFVIETGTFRGGSAVLWAMLLEQISPEGRVITIDIQDKRDPHAVAMPIARRRVDFLLGSSTAPEIVAEVKRRVGGRRAVVILDSLHTRDHVLAELRAYAPLVDVGSYVIVQDSAVNGHPVYPEFGPGPWEAVSDFLAEDDRFEIDSSRERLLLTSNPNGFLRRVR